MYKTIYNLDGQVDENKARLVVKCFSTKSICKNEHKKNNLFLSSKPKMATSPLGLIDEENPKYVCKFKKSLYGLKQAPRAWNDKTDKHSFRFGFKDIDQIQIYILTRSTI